MLPTINKRLLPMKLHYFLFNAGTGPVVPFLSVYMKELNFPSTVVGYIYTIAQIMGMLTKPTTGVIADRFKCQRIIFLTSILLSALSFLLLKFTPELSTVVNATELFQCQDNGTIYYKAGKNDTGLQCDRSLPASFQCYLKCPLTRYEWQTLQAKWNLFNVQYEPILEITALLINTSESTQFTIRNLTIITGESVIEAYCNVPFHLKCKISCDNEVINEQVSEMVTNQENFSVIERYEFWILLLLTVWTWVAQAACVSLGDAICFELLEDRPHKYGKQRVFGALGWGIITIITGLLIDYFSSGDIKKNLNPAFYMAIIILLLDFMTSLRIKYEQKKHSESIFKDILRLLAHLRISVFILWCICIGLCTGLMWQFQFWLVEDLAQKQGCTMWQWIKTLQGLIGFIQTFAGEVPFFFLSGWIFKRIGHRTVMTFIPLTISIRFVLYSVIANPWYFLPIELLNGITFGLFYACMASYASVVAPVGTESTIQGIVGAAFEGLGVSMGSLIGGVLFTKVGGALTFRYFGYGAFIVSVLHASYQLLDGKRRTNLQIPVVENTDDQNTHL